MKLNEHGLQNRKEWEEKGYKLPQFDRAAVTEATKENPFWIHFGPGNIFRAFQANVVQNLLNAGLLNRGLVVAEGYDYEIVEKMNQPHDDYNLLVTLKANGTVEKTVIGSVVESLTVNSENEADWKRLKEIFSKDSLQMASFTITEKGYSLVNGKGELLPGVEDDFINGPTKAMSYMGKVAALLYARYEADCKPIAMVSMDNCSHNGDKLYAAINTFAEKWFENGVVDVGFRDYVNDKKKVSFPWSMIDKITPRPDASVEAILRADGVEELEPVVTSKNTWVAPFVNAEETEYLVIEDDFPNGRSEALEKGGFMFTERETVDKVEKMKVCTCLNPLHTCLAIFGCILGYEKISDEMKDAELKKLVETVGYIEGLPVVVNPGILDPKEFIDTVLNVRIPNPFMPDTPQRIATDTSQKLAIRFGETIKAYVASEEFDVADLKLIPLVFAGWLRYLMGVNDAGEKFELSPDPLLDAVCPYVAGFKLGQNMGVESAIKPLLQDAKIWGVDLYEVGMADRVVAYLEEMLEGPGAVRATLKKYVQEEKSIKMFMDKDFLLSTEVAKKLYHEYAATMPIIDYHCHINPREIYEDRKFNNITQVWLEGDHYKWRQMRSNGVEEKYITGDATDREKFQKWAETLEMAIGNPLYHWSHLELKRYFGYEGILNGDTAEEVWNLCNENLAKPGMSARNLVKQSGVTLLCTTDDPIDSLEWHKKIKEDDTFDVQVLPTWRPDKALNIEKQDYLEYIDKLADVSGVSVVNFKTLLEALQTRMDWFEKVGCRISDHGLEYVFYKPATMNEIEDIFAKRLAGDMVTREEELRFKTAFLIEMGKAYHKKGWAMQLHYGVKRDNNRRVFRRLGPDAGIDSINNYAPSSELADFLNALAETEELPKTIIYSLNPTDNASIGSVIGCFQDASAIGKIQHGSAWWFNDHKQGMIDQMVSLANLGLLGNFIGMLTDSRSFLSYVRHEYFRRIMCELIGSWVANGEYPEDYKVLEKIVKGISYNNAVKYFNFNICKGEKR